MPYFSLKKERQSQAPSSNVIEENATLILPQGQTRKNYFRNAEHRRGVVFGPDMFIECDFCHGQLSFEDGLALSLPMVHFDLMRYWDGRPVWFVCCERSGDGKGPGNTIWCVGFEVMKEQEDEVEAQQSEPEIENSETLPDISDDVD